MANTNPNWTLTLPPIGDVKPFDPTFQPIPEGAYMATIVSAEQYVKDDPSKNSIGFKVKVTEAGEFQGRETTIFLQQDFQSEKAGRIIKAKWRTLLETLGANSQQLSTALQIGPNTFKPGNTVYVYVGPKPDGDSQQKYANVDFITQGQYQKLKAQAATSAHAAGTTPAATPQLGAAVGAPPAAFGAPTNGAMSPVGALAQSLGGAPTPAPVSFGGF